MKDTATPQTEIPDDELQALEEAARAATQGTWKQHGNAVHYGTGCVAVAHDPDGYERDVACANARHIEATQPKTTLRLLSSLAASRAREAALREALEYVTDSFWSYLHDRGEVEGEDGTAPDGTYWDSIRKARALLKGNAAEQPQEAA